MTIVNQNNRGLARVIVVSFICLVVINCDMEWMYKTAMHKYQGLQEEVTQEETVEFFDDGTDLSEEEKEQRRIFLLISEHCLPKLVCELHARIPSQSHFTDSERSLMSLIGSSFLGTVTPSKYHYAAHFGSLIQGYEGNGCHNFYPLCPFSGEDVQQIARKIPLK